MWPHVFESRVIPRASTGWAGESIAAAISCSAKIAENDTKHIGHGESNRRVDTEGLFQTLWGDVPSSPAAVRSCSVMEGSSDISFFRASL